jgi:hypothetical protein
MKIRFDLRVMGIFRWVFVQNVKTTTTIIYWGVTGDPVFWEIAPELSDINRQLDGRYT